MASQCQGLRSFLPLLYLLNTWGSAYQLSSGRQTYFSIIPTCQLCKWKSEWVGKLFCSKDLETAHPTSACIPRETRNATEKGKFLGPERHLGARKHDLQSEGPYSTKGTIWTLHTANQETLSMSTNWFLALFQWIYNMNLKCILLTSSMGLLRIQFQRLESHSGDTESIKEKSEMTRSVFQKAVSGTVQK